ncbi:leucyl/phenylalanyl-tRNA--protein transferase [Salinispirillum sp. LH 10-3-1]|uniref:Leucyl/phenylalanyl-tRNA--protein transferase n=1 Tax=Salinispirillum sp. LH 10-3-1 TaxID=2952525 RepID=A0AB38YB57_9GAMM
MSIFWLNPNGPPAFPPTLHALDDPNGLLATGGDLTTPWLTLAYQNGIFPWYADQEPILWWSPSPRCVFVPGELYLSRRLKRQLRGMRELSIRIDQDFELVMSHCASIERHGQPGTWITDEMQQAYYAMHKAGLATAVSVWDGMTLMGGIYGVSLGQMFFGESMFSTHTGGSKIALAVVDYLARSGAWSLIDAQVENAHLMSMGASLLPRNAFEGHLHDAVHQPSTFKVISQEFSVDAFIQDVTS